jgi:3'-5' exoribonuclease
MYIKTQKIYSLYAEDIVNDIFVLKSKQGLFRYSNDTKVRFEVRVADSSGEISLKFWGEESKSVVESLYNSLKVGDVLFVQGKVKEFNNMLEISTNQGVHRVEKVHEGEFDPSIFIKTSSKNVDALFKELYDIVDSLHSPDYKNVLVTFFEDKEWVNRFKKAPASMYRHYAYIGGLCEHTLNVVKLCMQTCVLHRELDRELLITGAILHDIGKMNYFSLGIIIEVSEKGALLGHLQLGVEMFTTKVREQHVSTIIQEKLKHIILSHLGKKRFGSPTTPVFAEALVIAQAKLLDSKTQGMIGAMKDAPKDAKVDYHKDFGMLYLG